MTGSEKDQSNGFDVLGIRVAVTNLQHATQKIINWKCDSVGRFVCVRDVHGIMLAQKNRTLFALHEKAALVTPDGMPLVAMGRILGHDVGRVCGADLMEAAIDKGRVAGTKHYFFGGAKGVTEELAERFLARFPGAEIVGCESPPFRDQTQQELAQTRLRIIQSKADIVWVGLSTPKQERWMDANFVALPATLVGVGAAFDFHSGRVKRAPLWMQRSGFEWLHRLVSEPKRLWRRYLLLAPKFVLAVVWRKFSNRRPA